MQSASRSQRWSRDRRVRGPYAEWLEPRQLLAASDVVLNELMYHPAETNTGGEYIELFNRGTDTVDLSGWKLSEGVSFTFPEGTRMAAGQFLVIFETAEAISYYGLSGAVGPYERQLDNSGERVGLSDRAGILIDSVTYDDDAPWPAAADGSGASLELLNPSLDNQLAGSWSLGQLHSPGKPNQPLTQRGEVILNEVMYRPEMRRYVSPIDPIASQPRWEDGEDAQGEFVELLNRSDGTIDVSAWKLLDNNGTLFELPANTLLAAGQYLVIAANRDAIATRYGLTDVLGNFATGRSLSNNGESLTLIDRQNRVVDFLRYSDSSPWPQGPDQTGVSLERIHPESDTNAPSSWRGAAVPKPANPVRPPVGTELYITRGTPGRVNSAAVPQVPPFIARNELQHLPARPGSSDSVTITARVQTTNTLQSVTLLYDTLVAPYQTTTSATQAMHDDGLLGDLVAGDGVFTIVLPPQATQTLLRYRVQATDDQGATAIYPDAAEPNPNRAYFVYDGEEETQLTSYFLIVPTATQRALDANIWTSEFLDATLVIDGIVHDHIGIHYRGRGWRVHPKKSYHVAFNKGEYFQGMSRLDLAMHFPTMQHLTHQLFAAAGVEPLGSEPIRLYRNGTFYGLMLAQDSPNASWLESNGMDPDSEIFKASSAPNYSPTGFTGDRMADLDYFSDASLYPRLYEKKGDSFGSYDSIIALTDLIANTPDDQLPQKLSQAIELDAWLTNWAVNVAGGNGDIIGTNFTLIKPSSPDARWQMRSFDFSHFFGCQMLDFDDVICNPYTQDPFLYYNHFHYRVMNHPTLKQRFLTILNDVLEHTLTSVRVNQLVDRTFSDFEIDRLDEVAKNIPGPPTHYVVYGSDQQEIKDYYAQRRNWLLNTWIPSQGWQPPVNQHPLIQLEKPIYAANSTTIRWTSSDAEKDASTVDLYWTDGQWSHFQKIEGAQGLPASQGQWVWNDPPGVINDNVFIQAIIRDGRSDLVGRDTSTRPALPPTPELQISDAEPTELRISSIPEDGTVFLTFDGTDPRGRDGQPSASATAYEGPTTLQENGLLRARLRRPADSGNGFVWSDAAEKYVVLRIPDLVITEIMYNPVGGSDYEFIEFFNRGTQPVRMRDLVAVGRTTLYDFSRSSLDVIQPGEYFLLQKNATRFQERYGAVNASRVGPFDQTLNNTGQNIDLKFARLPDAFLSVSYQDTWYPNTDGGGFSLVLIDPMSDPSTWNSAAAWRPSLRTNGSPGAADIDDPDVNDDNVVNLADIESICSSLRAGDSRYDFTQDGRVQPNDLWWVVQNVLKTGPGDANLDGRFDSDDLVRVFQAGNYESGLADSARWSTGDWNCDGRFTSSDLVLSFQSTPYAEDSLPSPALADLAFAIWPTKRTKP